MVDAHAAGRLAQRLEIEARGAQHFPVGGIDVAAPELIGEAEALGQLEHDPDIALRLAQGFDGRWAELREGARIGADLEVRAKPLALERRVDRQHDVGERGGRRHEHVHMHREVERLQHRLAARRIGVAYQDVGAEAHHALDGIGLALEDRAVEVVAGDPALLLWPERAARTAHCLRHLLGRDYLPTSDVVGRDRVEQHVAARRVEAAAQRIEERDGARGLAGICVLAHAGPAV